ncbi:unnamed protein product [Thlaspi arvense]|uniref:Uncharacterized protein n=1 Tax=Thlaspi arvense TaxID=13288 RepID=A0AAU9RLL7_THLAR|nr:unnamed protein product [Thlaspi arvense]
MTGRTIMGRKTGCRPLNRWSRRNVQGMWKRSMIKKRTLANSYGFKKIMSPSSRIARMFNSEDAIPPEQEAQSFSDAKSTT